MMEMLPSSARSSFAVRLYALASVVAVFLVTTMLGEAFLRTQEREFRDKQRLEAISQAATLRARLERELNVLLYLSSGLGGYLVVRNDRLQPQEVNDILAVLYRNSRHVRNFGVAIGLRLSFVYPREGNEQAVGLYYPDQPAQWPVIRKIVEGGSAVLAGPVDLVQGGKGLIYRVPLSIDGKYWGLLSTVIDSDSLFAAIREEPETERYEFAFRGKDGAGLQGDSILGDIALFNDREAVVQTLDVPGGQWAIAVKPRANGLPPGFPVRVRLAGVVLGGLIAWMLYTLFRHRMEFAHLAMYDGLTGLPNRRLLEDRAKMAFARQVRSPDRHCALLFLDLDGFKDINDQYGHKAGDAVLRAVAERARATVRANDTVARWGGDEFIVLVENVSRAWIDTLLERLRQSVEQPVDFEDHQLPVAVSIGVATYPKTGGNFDDILKTADRGMYADKAARQTGI